MTLKAVKFVFTDLLDFDCSENCEDLAADIKKGLDSGLNNVVSIKDGNEKVIALAGIFELRPGVVEAWIIRGHSINEYPHAFFKLMYSIMYKFVFPIIGVHRVQIAVKKEWRKWAEKLGLNFECVLEAYDDDYIDYYQYSKVVR